METIVTHHEKLYKAYYELPKRQRTRESDKAVEGFKAMIETITKKNGNGLRVQISTITSETGGDLRDIFEGYETICSSIEFAKVIKDSEISGIETGESEDEASTSAAGGEPAPTSHQADCEISPEDVQYQNEEVADLRKKMKEAIKDLRRELTDQKKINKLQEETNKRQEETIEQLRDDLNEMRSRLLVGEIVVRLNDYVKRGTRNELNSVRKLTESCGLDPAVDDAVKTMVTAAQEQFKDAKQSSPLGAFQKVAKRVNNSRLGVAHPDKVNIQTLKNACSGEATDQKLLNVLLAVAEDKEYPLRKIIFDEY